MKVAMDQSESMFIDWNRWRFNLSFHPASFSFWPKFDLFKLLWKFFSIFSWRLVKLRKPFSKCNRNLLLFFLSEFFDSREQVRWITICKPSYTNCETIFNHRIGCDIRTCKISQVVNKMCVVANNFIVSHLAYTCVASFDDDFLAVFKFCWVNIAPVSLYIG